MILLNSSVTWVKNRLLLVEISIVGFCTIPHVFFVFFLSLLMCASGPFCRVVDYLRRGRQDYFCNVFSSLLLLSLLMQLLLSAESCCLKTTQSWGQNLGLSLFFFFLIARAVLDYAGWKNVPRFSQNLHDEDSGPHLCRNSIIMNVLRFTIHCFQFSPCTWENLSERVGLLSDSVIDRFSTRPSPK